MMTGSATQGTLPTPRGGALPPWTRAGLVLVACVALTPDAVAAEAVNHDAFDRILRANVRRGHVDYLTIRERHWEALSAYLDAMAKVRPGSLGVPDRLAFYINLYNATMIRTVIERYRHGYSVAENGHAVFDEPLVRIHGGPISLNALENERVRKEFSEPRIHVGLVCAAVSCPRILPRAYRAADLDSTLESNMRSFVLDPGRNRVDTASRTVHLSRIFDWYGEDFEAGGGVLATFDRYHPGRLKGYAVAFMEYDWSLNLAPPASGRWIRVFPERADFLEGPGGNRIGGASRGEVFEVVGDRANAFEVRRPFGGGTAWIAKSSTAAYGTRTR